MVKKDDSAYIEDKTQIDALEEFSPKIREILREYSANRQLSSIAKKLSFHQSRLTEMITKNENGEYKKRITPLLFHRLRKKKWRWTVKSISQCRKIKQFAKRRTEITRVSGPRRQTVSLSTFCNSLFQAVIISSIITSPAARPRPGQLPSKTSPCILIFGGRIWSFIQQSNGVK